MRWRTYVALLLEHVSDLEPDVRVCERAGWVWQDVVEALEPSRAGITRDSRLCRVAAHSSRTYT